MKWVCLPQGAGPWSQFFMRILIPNCEGHNVTVSGEFSHSCIDSGRHYQELRPLLALRLPIHRAPSQTADKISELRSDELKFGIDFTGSGGADVRRGYTDKAVGIGGSHRQ